MPRGLSCKRGHGCGPDGRSLGEDRVRRCGQGCFQRITSQGVHPGAYDLQAIPADGRAAPGLAIDEWGIILIGSASRVALEMAREYPEHLRELVFDSPEVPQVDPFTEGILETRAALGQMAAACRVDAAAVVDSPILERAFEAASMALDQHPLSLRSGTTTGELVDVHLDGSMFLRGIRTLLAGEGDVVEGATPAVVYAALDATRPWFASTSPTISRAADAAPRICARVRPDEHSFGRCLPLRTRGDIAPFVDRNALTTLAGGDDTFASVFASQIGSTPAMRGACRPRMRASFTCVKRCADADPPGALRSLRGARVVRPATTDSRRAGS